jgi:hypothetical protein
MLQPWRRERRKRVPRRDRKEVATSASESKSIIGESSAEAATRRAVDFSGGTNLNGVRLYNERLVLSLIRKRGSLPKAAIARLTGLSPARR